MKDDVTTYEHMREQLADTATLYELAIEENDDSLDGEIREGLDKVRAELEFELCLCRGKNLNGMPGLMFPILK